MDWPSTEGGQPTQLRAGTSGWVCFPTSPPVLMNASGRDPMCLDQEWVAFGTAIQNKTAPQTKRVGIGYMLMGDAGGSNTDPFATDSTADNYWVHSPPHLMILVPDVSTLQGLPSDPHNGGP